MIKKEYNFTMVGEVWYYIHPYSLQIIQPIVERYIMVFLWDPLLLTMLQLPFGLFILFLGFLLLLSRIIIKPRKTEKLRINTNILIIGKYAKYIF